MYHINNNGPRIYQFMSRGFAIHISAKLRNICTILGGGVKLICCSYILSLVPGRFSVFLGCSR